jgi:2-keto-4-pentenoate hydratase/2-oxohepta-3-ene-1,7-dioic acid hydratase in catechol pathway
MKLVRFRDAHGAAVGLLTPRGVVKAPYADMTALIAASMSDRSKLRSLAAEGQAVPETSVRLLAPIDRPRNVLAIGLNYSDHIAETGVPTPEQQVWFNKQPSCIVGPSDTVEIPKVSMAVDWEAELVVVIGRACRHVPANRAVEVIAGYTCGNDVSVRDWQWKTPQWMLGKSFDTHGPIGPCIVTPDEWDATKPHGIRCIVNGARKQSSTVDKLVFNVFQQIEHLTQAMTLAPGDIIFTGTPGGVGAAMKPPQFLKAGDTVRVEIDGIGALENPVAAEAGRTLGLD